GEGYSMTMATRSYIVTAAAGGIGSELISLLVGRGDNVYAVDISTRRLAALQERVGGGAGQLVTRKADVTRGGSGKEAVDEAIKCFSRIDGLANIAGGIVGIGNDLIDCDIEQVSAEDFRKSFQLNVDSAFMMIRALVPHFGGNRYGKIANVASLAAFG